MFTYPQGFMKKDNLEIHYRSYNSIMSSSSVYNFNSIDIGEESPDRLVIVFCQAWHNAGATMSSVRVGDITGKVDATNIIGWLSTGAGSAIIAEGSLVNIRIGWNTTLSGCTLHVYTIYGVKSEVPVVNLKKATSPLELIINPPKNTAIIAYGSNYNEDSNWTWSGTLGIGKDSQGYQSTNISTSVASMVTSRGQTGTVRANHPSSFNVGSMIILGFK